MTIEGTIEQDLQVIKDPGRWGVWPFLPLMRRSADQYGNMNVEFAVMLARNDTTTTVFHINMIEFQRTLAAAPMTHIHDFPHTIFDSVEQIIAEGWRIDN
jgi:hypothetical protein